MDSSEWGQVVRSDKGRISLDKNVMIANSGVCSQSTCLLTVRIYLLSVVHHLQFSLWSEWNVRERGRENERERSWKMAWIVLIRKKESPWNPLRIYLGRVAAGISEWVSEREEDTGRGRWRSAGGVREREKERMRACKWAHWFLSSLKLIKVWHWVHWLSLHTHTPMRRQPLIYI